MYVLNIFITRYYDKMLADEQAREEGNRSEMEEDKAQL
tara:strand:- start:943 stop:1056 length:114 start_codon:yes stop_codon:yes gene_type:complete